MVEPGQVVSRVRKSSRVAFWGVWAQLALTVFAFFVLFGSPHSDPTAEDRRANYGFLAFMAAGSLFALVASRMLVDARHHKTGRITAAVMGAILLLTIVFSVVGLFLIGAAVVARSEAREFSGQPAGARALRPWHLALLGTFLAWGFAAASQGISPDLFLWEEGLFAVYLPGAAGLMMAVPTTRRWGKWICLLYGGALAYTFFLIPLAAPFIGAWVWQWVREIEAKRNLAAGQPTAA